jgi:hypothetical protein
MKPDVQEQRAGRHAENEHSEAQCLKKLCGVRAMAVE